MSGTAKIAAVRGAGVKTLFRALAEQWGARLRLAGVVAEDHDLEGRVCTAGYLRSLRGGERFAMFHDLGNDPALCHLDGGGVAGAASLVKRDIASGCDVVLLSKFGKLEAAGEGLYPAFVAARDAGLPLITSVSPAQDAAWRQFTGPRYSVLPADDAAIETWLATARRVAA